MWIRLTLIWKQTLTPSCLRNEIRNCYDKYSNDLHYIDTRLINIAYIKFANFCVHVIKNYWWMSKWCGFCFCWVYMFMAGSVSTIVISDSSRESGPNMDWFAFNCKHVKLVRTYIKHRCYRLLHRILLTFISFKWMSCLISFSLEASATHWDMKRDFYAEKYTISDLIEVIIWTICAFRIFNPY